MDWKTFIIQNAARDPRFARMAGGLGGGRPAAGPGDWGAGGGGGTGGPGMLRAMGVGWPLRTGILCGVAVVVLPLILVVLIGLLVGGVVYAVASVVAQLGEALGLGGGSGRSGSAADAGGEPAMPGDEYRENVRVVPRG